MPISRRISRAFLIYTVFSEPLFWGPVIVLAIQKLGHMSLPEFYFMESVVVALVTLADAPFGALADVIGRKPVLIAGCILKVIGTVMFAAIHTPLEVWAANIVFMLGISLAAGADTALLRDALEHDDVSSKFRGLLGRASAGRLWLAAGTTLATGIMADWDLRLPLILCIPGMCVPLVAVCFMEDHGITKSRYSVKGQWNTLAQGAVVIVRSKELRFIVLFSAFICCASMLWFYTYNPYFDTTGVPLSSVGMIFCALNLVAGTLSYFAHPCIRSLGEKVSVTLMVVCVSVPPLLMGVLPGAALAPLVLCQNFTRGLMMPFETEFLNRCVGSDVRTTVASFHSTGRRLIYAVALMGFGVVIDHAGLFESLVLLGTCSCALGLGFIWWFGKKY